MVLFSMRIFWQGMYLCTGTIRIDGVITTFITDLILEVISGLFGTYYIMLMNHVVFTLHHHCFFTILCNEASLLFGERYVSIMQC